MKEEKGVYKNNRKPKEWFQSIWSGVTGASTKNHPAPYPEELAERLIRMFSFVGDTVLEVFPEFKYTSYAKRYELFCERLVRERLYDAACFLMSNEAIGLKGGYIEPNEELGFKAFASSLIGHAMGYAKITCFRLMIN